MTNVLKILAGQTLTVTANNPLLSLYDVLEMEDNSKLIAKIDINLQALSATFGQNCVIDGSASDAKNGDHPTSIPKQAPQRGTGTEGYAGGNGFNGERGRNITLQIGIRSIGSLLVKSNGGRGGDGAQGGTGGQGGGALCIEGPGGSGGRAGVGGNAGAGGDSGVILIRWMNSPHSDLINTPSGAISYSNLRGVLLKERQLPANYHGSILASLPGLQMPEAKGGQPGHPGLPGTPGRGGDGVNCGFYSQGGGSAGSSNRGGSTNHGGASIPPIIEAA